MKKIYFFILGLSICLYASPMEVSLKDRNKKQLKDMLNVLISNELTIEDEIKSLYKDITKLEERIAQYKKEVNEKKYNEIVNLVDGLFFPVVKNEYVVEREYVEKGPSEEEEELKIITKVLRKLRPHKEEPKIITELVPYNIEELKLYLDEKYKVTISEELSKQELLNTFDTIIQKYIYLLMGERCNHIWRSVNNFKRALALEKELLPQWLAKYRDENFKKEDLYPRVVLASRIVEDFFTDLDEKEYLYNKYKKLVLIETDIIKEIKKEKELKKLRERKRKRRIRKKKKKKMKKRQLLFIGIL